jgi:anti-anti-sigma factor
MFPVSMESTPRQPSGGDPGIRFVNRSVGVLELRGDLLRRLSPRALWRFLAPARADGVRDLVVDLRRVSCVNCVGLGALLGLRRMWEDSGGRLCLLGASAKVRSLIEVSGLRGELPCEFSEEDALVRFIRDTGD